MATSYTLAGTAKARGLGSVDPRLVQIIAAAAERSPYQVQIFSGKRAGSQGGSRHNSGNALDIALIDPTTGQVVPNYKSSTGFPIYAEFAKIAREEQMRLAPDMADQFRWGGGFSDKSFDLMHFDFKPGGSMRYWTWEDGGKLTPLGAQDVPKFGAGYVYANGERYKAPPGQYASLWGREPLQAQPQPQDAQSAIASLLDPGGGTQVPEPQSPLMGFAPGAPELGIGPAAQPPMPRPPMEPPPQWAQAGGFPMDEALTGSSAQDVLAGGPRLDPRRAIGSAPVGPTTDQGVLDMGPNLRPPGPQVNMPTPPMRPGNFVFNGGGAPDAGTVPSPPMRPDPFASTFPPRPEGPAAGMPPAPRMGDLSAAMGGPPAPPAPALRTDGGQEPPGARTPASTGLTPALMDRLRQRQGIGPFPARPEFPGALPAAPNPYDDPSRQFDTPPFLTAWEMSRDPVPAPPPTPQPPPEARTKDDAYTPPPPMDFSIASEAAPPLVLNDPYANQRGPSSLETAQRNFQMPAGWTPGQSAPPAAFRPPSDQAYEWFHGFSRNYTGEGGAFPETPLPQPPGAPVAAAPPLAPATWGKGLPVPSFMSEDQFNVSFSPGGPGMIADMTPPVAPPPSQAGNPFDAIMGPGAAMGAMPFNDVAQGIGAPAAPPSPANVYPAGQPVPGFEKGRFTDAGMPGATPAPSVVRPPTPVPGQPGVVSGEMPSPMDIRPPAQGGPPLPPAPAALPQAAAPVAPRSAPRQPDPGAERQRNSILGRVLGGLLGGPIGALGGGLLGGNGAGFGFGGQPTYAWTGGGGSAPYGNGGTTTYQKGTSNALGGSNALSWKGSGGQQVTVVQDPWTGTYYGPTTTGGGLY